MHRKTPAIAAAAMAAAALAIPAVAGAHTTISALQPQGSLLTSARGTYVVRSPNETPTQRTWKIVMYVPQPLQESISVRQLPDWKVRMKTTDTGKKDSDGNAVLAVSRISWTAKSRDDEVAPHFYGEWPVRFQNPPFAGKLCFGFSQFYTNLENGSRRNPDIVQWTGAAASEHPSSCLTIVDAPPASS
ncbi:MAG: hypothetical protein QOJ82_274 [Solirubrobacteraceae bacterium]|jgi:hypothetical protein|nr:hypothetical protein [Solirubrobacteraceae bacterium]